MAASRSGALRLRWGLGFPSPVRTHLSLNLSSPESRLNLIVYYEVAYHIAPEHTQAWHHSTQKAVVINECSFATDHQSLVDFDTTADTV